jgi:hypothetical protein
MPLILPLKVGVCKIPPRKLHWDEYNPGRDGPLVNCHYKTAIYPEQYDNYISYNNHEFIGKVFTKEQWDKLPNQITLKNGMVDKKAIFYV